MCARDGHRLFLPGRLTHSPRRDPRDCHVTHKKARLVPDHLATAVLGPLALDSPFTYLAAALPEEGTCTRPSWGRIQIPPLRAGTCYFRGLPPYSRRVQGAGERKGLQERKNPTWGPPQPRVGTPTRDPDPGVQKLPQAL